jgi:hypothetical protein
MITRDPRWSLPRGNTLVPSRWQATLSVMARSLALWGGSGLHRCLASRAAMEIVVMR